MLDSVYGPNKQGGIREALLPSSHRINTGSLLPSNRMPAIPPTDPELSVLRKPVSTLGTMPFTMPIDMDLGIPRTYRDFDFAGLFPESLEREKINMKRENVLG